MSRFGEVMKNVIIGDREGAELYNRIFVVSAYGGITNLLLENKKTGEPGVYGKFAADPTGSEEWLESLEAVRESMMKLNRSLEDIGLNLKEADDFVNERINGVRNCLKDLVRLRSYGHFHPVDYLPATREFLSALGEAHSARNSAEVLKANGMNARFIDLTGWKKTTTLTLDEMILAGFRDVDFETQLPIVTGYVKYDEGIMTRFDRGYSEITFSKIAVLTEAKEGIIHKEFHLSSGDPKLMGVDNVVVIGNTNFDIADQLADMDMEAIHSKASKEMELCNIPIRVKNAFEPAHPGTLISKDYVSPDPRVEIICGRDDVLAVEVFDAEMVGEVGYDHKLVKKLSDAGISYIAKNTNANTITHFIPQNHKNVKSFIEDVKNTFPGAQISCREVAIVSVIGSNMAIPGLLYRGAGALANAGINILALDQCMRQVNMQFIVEREDFENAQVELHKEYLQ